jgi:hypothetical protein
MPPFICADDVLIKLYQHYRNLCVTAAKNILLADLETQLGTRLLDAILITMAKHSVENLNFSTGLRQRCSMTPSLLSRADFTL